MRRRFGLWAHHTGQAAASSPALVSRAGEAVVAVVAVAVVTGAPVVNPLPQAAAPDRPTAVVAEQRASSGQGVFAPGPSGLQVSSDNGATFTTLVPLSGPTAVSPVLPIDHRIIIGAVPGWEYRDDTNSTTPLHLDNRPQGHTLTFAFSPAYGKD